MREWLLTRSFRLLCSFSVVARSLDGEKFVSINYHMTLNSRVEKIKCSQRTHNQKTERTTHTRRHSWCSFTNRNVNGPATTRVVRQMYGPAVIILVPPCIHRYLADGMVCAPGRRVSTNRHTAECLIRKKLCLSPDRIL